MPIRFAAPGGLRPGHRPVEVPPPTGAMMSPSSNELPGLAQVVGDNLHARGTPAWPGFSAQVQPLSRPVDPGDLEALDSIGNPTKLGAMATRASVRTQTMDSMPQMLQRQEQMGNRSAQQLQTEVHGAQTLVDAVAQPQMVQQSLGQQRLMEQQMAQAGGRDATSDFANAQEFSARYRQSVMSPQGLAALDNLAGSIADGANMFVNRG